MPISPVFYHPGGRMPENDFHDEPEGWYFWTENWVDYMGPFTTRDAAVSQLTKYAKTL